MATINPLEMPTSNQSVPTTQTNPAATTTKPTTDTNKILSLPSFASRGAAIAKRLEDVKADPKYQALPEEHKAKVRASIYDKYVPKSYAGFHLPVPDKNTWVGATGRDTSIRDYNIHTAGKQQKLSESYSTDRQDQMGKDLVVGASKAWDGIALFGAKVTNKAFSSMHGLDSYFSHKDDTGLLAKSANIEKSIQRNVSNYEDAQRAKIQSDDFWIQTHPRDTVIGSLAGLTGELIATLPLYEAIGAVAPVARAGEAAAKVLPLTARLASTPVGKFVAKRIISASDFYLASLSESGGNKTTAANEAKGVAEFEGAAAIGGKYASAVGGEFAKSETGQKLIQKIASAPLIKKWTANTIAMGGIPFAQDVAQSAHAEMNHADDWFMKPGNLTDLTIGKDHELTHGIIVHPATDTTGHFTDADMNVYSYGSRETQQKGYEELARRAEAKRNEMDPVMAKLHEAEKVSQNSIAMAKYGKPLVGLEDKDKLEVLAERWQQINQAALEAPVHLPELHKDEVTQNIAKARIASPAFNNFAAGLEKLGVDIPGAVTENNISAIAKETGISNVEGATKKLNKAEKRTKGTSISPEQFAQHKVDTNAYLRAPRNRIQVAEAISDRSKEGLIKFKKLLRDAGGNRLHFENAAHEFLYHYGNRKQLPEGLANSLVYRIKQLKGYENASTKDIQKEADWLHVHLSNLAGSGRLASEGNMFRSSKLTAPFSWTKWQHQLSEETDAAMLAPARAALKQHPHALKGFDATVKAIQAASANITTPDEYITFKRTLAESSHNILLHVADKKLGGIIQ